MPDAITLVYAAGILIAILAILLPFLARPREVEAHLLGPEDPRWAQEPDPQKRLEALLRVSKQVVDKANSEATFWGALRIGVLVGQYVVGAILTSTFFTKVAPASLAGSIGLLVLVCTAVNQRFRPGVRQSGAVQRAQKLRVILRAANDEFARLRSSRTPGEAVEKLIQKVFDAMESEEEAKSKALNTDKY
jgi:hypothetical protein